MAVATPTSKKASSSRSYIQYDRTPSADHFLNHNYPLVGLIPLFSDIISSSKCGYLGGIFWGWNMWNIRFLNKMHNVYLYYRCKWSESCIRNFINVSRFGHKKGKNVQTYQLIKLLLVGASSPHTETASEYQWFSTCKHRSF
jgi:hypothetical protein